MLSYKQYKQLNESLYGFTSLGVTTPAAIGVMGATGASEAAIEEGKKKKMLADVEDKEDAPEDEAPADDEGDPKAQELADLDDEEGGDCGEMQFCKKGMKKKSKKNMKAEGNEEKCQCGKNKCECGAPAKRPQMTEDELAWWSSVHDMLDFNPDGKNWDGIAVKEDALIEPPAQDGLVYKNDEPQAGDVGFAPQGRIGYQPADPGWKYSNS